MGFFFAGKSYETRELEGKGQRYVDADFGIGKKKKGEWNLRNIVIL